MSLSVGELYAKLVLDKTKFENDLKHSEGSSKTWGSKVHTTFARAAKLIVAALATIGAAVIGLAIDSIAHAQEQERANLKIQAAYGKSAAAVQKWAEDNSVALAVTDNELEQAAGKYGIWAKNVGFSTKQAASDGEELAKRAAEISISTGQSFDDVFGALMKGSQGATKGLKAYGGMISSVAIKHEALKLGLYSGKGALSDYAKSAALHVLIMKNTAAYVGIAANSQDLLATKTRRMGAIVDNVLDTLGKVFLNVASSLIDTFVPIVTAVVAFFMDNMPTITKIVQSVFNTIQSIITPIVDLFMTVFYAIANGLDQGSVAAEAFAEGPFGTLGVIISNITAAIVGFLSSGNDFTYFMQALGIIIATVVVPPVLAFAAGVIIAAAPVIALIAGLTLLIKWLNDTGVGAQILTQLTQGLTDATNWLAVNVVPLLATAFTWITTNAIPALQAALVWISQNVLPALSAAFNFLTTTILPALIAIAQWLAANILPVVAAAFSFLTNTVLPAVGAAFTWIVTNILPPVIAIITTIFSVIIPALVRAFLGAVSWVQENLPIIGDIFGMVAKLVGIAVDVISRVVKLAFEVIANVIGFVAPIIVKVGEVVFPIVAGAATDLLHVIKFVFEAIGNIWNTAWTIASVVAGGIGSAFGVLSGIFKGVMDGITGVVKGGLNLLLTIVNGIISAVNMIQVHIGKIGLDTPAGFVGVGPFDWNGLNLGKIPYLAAGTNFFGGGWAKMNENGPELVKLPRGSQVVPHSQVGGPRGMGGNGPLIGEQHIYGIQPDEVERQTSRAIRRAALNWTLEGHAT